jgi:hypothetical protein
MSGEMQIVLAWVSTGIAIAGILISIFAYRNSYQARSENRTNVLFRLKIEALTAAHEVAALWQSAIDEIVDLQLRAGNPNGATATPIAQIDLKLLNNWKEEFRNSRANATKIAQGADQLFEKWSAENAAKTLRTCIASRIVLEHAREKMQRRFTLLYVGPIK